MDGKDGHTLDPGLEAGLRGGHRVLGETAGDDLGGLPRFVQEVTSWT